MATRRDTKASSREENNSSKLSSSSASEKSKIAATKSTTSRQTSLRNFFGTAGTTKRTVSFQKQNVQKKASNFCLLTPPTPVSPQSLPTPPTEQDAHAAATPPSPDNVAVVFKKAKRETSQEKNVTDSRVSKSGKKALEQTYLDLGQVDFGKRTICQTCGMLYVHGLNEDSKQHSRICMDYMKGVPFTVPQARVVATDSKGSIVEVRWRVNVCTCLVLASSETYIMYFTIYTGSTLRQLYSSEQGKTGQGDCRSRFGIRSVGSTHSSNENDISVYCQQASRRNGICRSHPSCLSLVQFSRTIVRATKGHGGYSSIVGSCQVSETRNCSSPCRCRTIQAGVWFDYSKGITCLFKSYRSWIILCSKICPWRLDELQQDCDSCVRLLLTGNVKVLRAI